MISSDLSPAELEAHVAKMLKDATRGRSLDIKHHGTTTRAAPGGMPDIDVSSDDIHAIVEVTKLRGVAQSNAEATSVTAHLDTRAVSSPGKQHFGIFVSPATAGRTREAFRLYNDGHRQDRRWFVALDFDAYNLLTEFLASPEGQALTLKQLIDALEGASGCEFDDDVLQHLNAVLFKRADVADEIRRIRQDRLAEKYARLDSVFKKLHDGLRTVVGLGPPEAFHELSKLIFLKMYEEQRVDRDLENGKLPENNFTRAYIAREKAKHPPPKLHPIIEFFDRVREQYASEGLFDPDESIDIERDKIDGNYIDIVVAQIEDFQFIDPTVPIDIKGMIYEQFLGLSLKNTDLGQYFTPDPIIDFVVRLAQLAKHEHVHDPACGTGRFLVSAMAAMLSQCTSDTERDRVRGELITGVEKSPYVAKIAKMNMFVHGDGRSGIRHGDSLDVDPADAPKYDVILTNPPLGEIHFKDLKGDYETDEAWYDAFRVIPLVMTTSPRTKEVTTKVPRNELKGGALFLNLFMLQLNPGGRVLTIIDDAILNTDEYRETRNLVREHFEILAVFSLTDDAFKYASKTATKTSVLLMVRKANLVEQTRPVFFGHAFKVGINTRGKATRNDLYDPGRPLDLLRAYQLWEKELNAGAGKTPGITGKLENIGFDAFSDCSYFTVPFDQLDDRLEFKYYDPTYKPVEDRLSAMDTVRLADIVDWPSEKWPGEYGLTATGLEQGDHEFINIENLRPEGTIDVQNIRYVMNESVRQIDAEGNEIIKPKVVTEEGDLLISRSRLPGIAAVVGSNEAGMIYGSYIIRFRLRSSCGFLPRYVALFINSIFGQTQVHRLKSGSNGFNINAGQLGELRILRLDADEQARVVATVTSQQGTAVRLGALMRHYQLTAERMLLEACLGEQSDRRLTEIDDALTPAITAAQEVLFSAQRPGDEIDEIGRLGERFIIRPTFSGRTPSGDVSI